MNNSQSSLESGEWVLIFPDGEEMTLLRRYHFGWVLSDDSKLVSCRGSMKDIRQSIVNLPEVELA